MSTFTLKTNTGNNIILNDADEINRGGEGRILTIKGQPKQVAKLYLPGKQAISERQFRALAKLNTSHFVVPQELLYKGSDIVGYTMEFIGGDYFGFSNLLSKNFCKKHNIGVKLKNTVAEKLIAAVRTVHTMGYIIGDLNQFNILFNLSGDLKFIDTDSYQTPAHAHSGLVLEEIRDFQRNGTVDKESDYFALAILLFYMFSYTHPFKGIHAKYKNMRDRMIHKITVFSGDAELKVPRCYVPVADPLVTEQFNRIFAQDERFLFSMQGKQIRLTQTVGAAVSGKIEQDKLIIRDISHKEPVLDVYFNLEQGYIEHTDRFVVYSAKNRGYLNRKYIIKKDDADSLYLSAEHVFIRKGEKLFVVKAENDYAELKNVQLGCRSLIAQKENILAVIDDDVMYWLYLNDVIGNNIRIKRTEVFGKAFSNQTGFIQRQGGVNRLFYPAAGELATVKTDKNIKALRQNAHTGIMQYIESGKLINRFFKLSGLTMEFAPEASENFAQFSYMPTGKASGLLFIPADGEISIKRTDDFAEISKINCEYISEQTALFYSKAGIIAWEDDAVNLVNTK